MPVGARNAIIILGLAALVVVWERAFTVAIATASQVISILFVVAMLAAGVAYFRRNQLAWLVLRPWQRVAIVLAALAIAFLLVAGYPLLFFWRIVNHQNRLEPVWDLPGPAASLAFLVKLVLFASWFLWDSIEEYLNLFL